MYWKNAVTLTMSILLLIAFRVNGEWTSQNSGVQDNLYGVHFLNENYGYAVGWGASNGAVILRTTDGGEEWSSSIPVRNSYLFSITFLDSLHGFAVGYSGNQNTAMLLETINGGDEWMSFTFNESFGFYVVQFTSEDVGYVCGYGGAILKTSDGGWTWDALETGTGNVFRKMHFVDDEVGYAACGTSFNNTNMIYKTTNGGEDWEMIRNFGNTFVIGGVHFFNADSGVVAGNDGHEAVYRTDDGGESWERTYTTDSRQVLQAVNFDENSGWAVSGAGRIHYSDNAGEEWELDDSFGNVDYWFDAFEVGQVAYVVGTDGSIYKTNIEGQSIANESEQQPSLFELHQNYPNPFNPTTTISFEIGESGMVSLNVFDINGSIVSSVIEKELGTGRHSFNFNSAGIPPGSYFYQLKTVSGESTRKMILLK